MLYAYMGMAMGSAVAQYPMVSVDQGVSYAYRGYNGNSDGQMQSKHRRFRRRYYQIFRKYNCLFPGCTKSYGSLNHLNTHIVTKKHGLRKSKQDFKDAEDDESTKKMRVGTHLPKVEAHLPKLESPLPKLEPVLPKLEPHLPKLESPLPKSEPHLPTTHQLPTEVVPKAELSQVHNPLPHQTLAQLREATELETSTSEQSPPIMLPVQQAPSLWKSSPELLKPLPQWSFKCAMPTLEVGMSLSCLVPPALAQPHGSGSIRLPLIPSIITRCDSTA